VNILPIWVYLQLAFDAAIAATLAALCSSVIRLNAMAEKFGPRLIKGQPPKGAEKEGGTIDLAH
jgi:hypothetical protein